ncbi:ROK family protein [Akkermansia muciniphila]|uniref:ROK family protein n=2 Tax=Akkermansia TaxID=239934 RepID=UPI000B8EB5AD|nr:ROK family protein [Akkermansia muciniphila]
MSFSEPCALAVDFGGTSIKMGVTAGDRILATADRIPTAMFESPQAIIDAMIAAARTLRGQFPTACVMGMGMPGWCDYQQGVLYQLTNVRVWDRQIPVKEMMEQALGLPVVLDNDANCMAYAEWKLGAGRGMSSLVCLTMGTGIGGGIVVHDRMLRGRRLSAAELGQTSIHYQGKTGPFGSRGAIEEYIGNNELAAEAVKRYAGAGIVKTADECTPRHLDEAARSGCPIALQLWEDTAEMLSCLIMNLMYTLVPDAFIIGGGVAKAGDLLMKPLLENLRKQLFPLLMEDLRILPARFGAEAGLLGAGAMAMDEFMGLGILERFKNKKSPQASC